MAAHVSAGNIHNFYLAGQVYRGQAYPNFGFTNPFKEPSWYHFFLIPNFVTFCAAIDI